MPQLTILQKLDSRKVVNTRIQNRINNVTDIDTKKLLAITAAEASQADYPQYHKYWDSFTPCYVMRKIVTKAGVAFESGDFAIVANPNNVLSYYVTVYSVRNGHNTSVLRRDIEFLSGK